MSHTHTHTYTHTRSASMQDGNAMLWDLKEGKDFEAKSRLFT